MIKVDSSYFGRLVIAPYNIVYYNVFTSHGPDLYGTEPFHFYFVNGFLNFNLVFVAALVAPLMLVSRVSNDFYASMLIIVIVLVLNN